jgi:hypothetical protein
VLLLHFVRRRKNCSYFKLILNSFIVRSLLRTEPPRNPLNEIEDYCTYFNNRYGTRHPTFYRGKLSQVFGVLSIERISLKTILGSSRCST